MSYRPRSRSRSPDYRPQRRYSPSRPLSPMRGEAPRHPSDDRALPPRPMSPRDRARGRYDDYPPPPRRYDDDYPPPPRRYEDDYRPRPPHAYDDRSPYEDGRYALPPTNSRHSTDYNDDYGHADDRRGRYEDRDRPSSRQGMMADREEVRPRAVGSGPLRSEPQWDRGRDVGELSSLDASHQSDHPNRRGPKGPSERSRDIIFLGLDPELSETDFTGYLRTEHNVALESVKIVRDKLTGKSKCFGFAQFRTIDDAEEFMGINYPAVLMPALYAHSEPRKVKVDYSAPPPVQQSSLHHEAPTQSYSPAPVYVPPAHDGMRDIGTPGEGKRVLLLRGLDPSTTAKTIITRFGQEIARMMGRTGRETVAESTIVRVAQIVDRSARSNWGYAFVELVTAELASALLPFLLTPQHQPNGFIIDYIPVAASFANPASFIPITAGPLGGEFVLRPSRNGGIGSDSIGQPEAHCCTYWHHQGGPVETASRGAPVIGESGSFDLTSDHRAFLGTLAGVPLQVLPLSHPADTAHKDIAPINVSGGIQPIKIGGGKGKKKEEIAMIPIMGKNLLGGDEEEVDLIGKDTVLLSRTKGIHIIPPTSSSRKIAKNISKWNTKQTELAVIDPIEEPNAPPKGISDVNATLGFKRSFGNASTSSGGASVGDQSTAPSASVPGPSKSPQQASDDFDYTDLTTLATTGKVACLLCQRQFKTEEVLRKHVAQSDLHKTNLADENAKDSGQRRKLALKPSNDTDTAPKYRDRAAERREVFNQPAMPLPSESPSWAAQQEKKRKYAEGPKPPPPPPPPGLEPAKDESNVGNALLAKMGWKSGTGLGKEGEGRVNPIQVQQFESRAGLGASKGVEAGRWTGPGGFQQRALDMAKQRYDNAANENESSK